MVVGSVRGFKYGGIPFSVANDANISFNPTTTTESLRTSGGNVFKITTEAGDLEAIKLLVDVNEYATLESLNDDLGNNPISYIMSDGSSRTSQGRLTLGPHMSEDGSCEVTGHTATGKWDSFGA